MTMHDDDRHHTAPMALVRPRRNRAKAVAGVAGLAVALGAGAFAITTALVSEDEPATRDVTAIGQPAPAPFASAPADTSSTGESAEPMESPEHKTTASPTKSKPVEQQIKEAREKAAKDGFPLQRALTAAPGAAPQVGEVTVTNEGPQEDGGTLRTISARYDLTGQRELLWVTDSGEKVGDAQCSQKFRFSNNSAPRERPTMLMCWRTSSDRSVITIAVEPKGRPDAESTVGKLEKQWNTMG
ncbi:hypothetical protein [Actinoplanes subglobosus]|uniref:Serine/threonine protein kinase n=1 Tax=Actinoplanes subglobosus TaxID=1547892 RepID=A0ABV8IKE8_9ACTN